MPNARKPVAIPHDPPRDLPKHLRPFFRRIVRQMGSLAGLTTPETVARLCRLRDQESQLQTIIDREGVLVAGARKNRVRHPMLTPLKDVRREITRLESQLGLNPNSLKRITGRAAPKVQGMTEQDAGMVLLFHELGREAERQGRENQWTVEPDELDEACEVLKVRLPAR
jgi:P27 family predicted phage terminase small subunit